MQRLKCSTRLVPFFLAMLGGQILLAQHSSAGSRPASESVARQDRFGFVPVVGGARHCILAIQGGDHAALVVSLELGRYPREPIAALATALGIALKDAAPVAAAPADAASSEAEGKGDLWQVRLVERTLHVAGVVPTARAEAALGKICDLLSGAAPLRDGDLVVAISRARLAADDAVNVLPGPMLEVRARRELKLPGASHGRPESYDFTPERVRAALRDLARAENASFVALTGGDPAPLAARFATWSRHIARTGHGLAGRSTPASSGTDRVLPEVDAVRVHAQVDAPFVAVTFRAPDPSSDHYVPFLVAVEVLRARAFAAFQKTRGGEAQARFPFVAFDPWEGSPLVAIQRRGKNGDDVEDTQRELRAFLQRLRTEPALPEEVARAGVGLCRTLWLPPYTGADEQLARQPRLLLTRAVTLAAAWSQGWPQDLTSLVQKVDTGVVRSLLLGALAPENLVWSTLVPGARAGEPVQKR